MALNIKSERAHQLAHQVAERTGQTLTEVVTEALERRLSALGDDRDGDLMDAEVAEIQAFLAAIPDRDDRSPEEILGYDSHGLPT